MEFSFFYHLLFASLMRISDSVDWRSLGLCHFTPHDYKPLGCWSYAPHTYTMITIFTWNMNTIEIVVLFLVALTLFFCLPRAAKLIVIIVIFLCSIFNDLMKQCCLFSSLVFAIFFAFLPFFVTIHTTIPTHRLSVLGYEEKKPT